VSSGLGFALLNRKLFVLSSIGQVLNFRYIGLRFFFFFSSLSLRQIVVEHRCLVLCYVPIYPHHRLFVGNLSFSLSYFKWQF